MTGNDIKEIKKQFSLDNCTIDHICGCYVNNEKEKQAVSRDAFMSLSEEEQHKYFEIFKKTLTGTAGKNLIEMEFPLAEEAAGGKQAALLELRDSHLEDEALIESFYDKVIESYDTVEKYYIILIHAIYDIPGMTKDMIINEDASEGVFDYICCAICPVKLEKGTLSYDPETEMANGSIVLGDYAIVSNSRTPDVPDVDQPLGVDNIFVGGEGAPTGDSSPYAEDSGEAIVGTHTLVLLLNSAKNDAASGVIDSTKGLADSSLKLIGEVKSPRLSIVA